MFLVQGAQHVKSGACTHLRLIAAVLINLALENPARLHSVYRHTQ